MSSADIRGMFAGLPGAHGIIEAALNGQGLVMTDDAAHPKSAAVLAGDSSSSAANRRKNWCGAH